MRLFVLCIAAVSLSAQTFEVASVKPNHTGDGGHGFPRLRNGVMTVRNVSLKSLLSAAYNLTGARIIGPSWLEGEYFDVAARAPEGVPDSNIGPMLQAMLKDRFRAVCHLETRELPAYDLIVDKGGAKLTPFDPAHPPEPPRVSGGSALMGAGTTSQIADMVSGPAGRPVVDRTGIQGRFFYAIHYGSLNADTATDGALPDIFAAVQEQLGLRLESKKEMLEILVVDSIDHVPSGN